MRVLIVAGPNKGETKLVPSGQTSVTCRDPNWCAGEVEPYRGASLVEVDPINICHYHIVPFRIRMEHGREFERHVAIPVDDPRNATQVALDFLFDNAFTEPIDQS